MSILNIFNKTNIRTIFTVSLNDELKNSKTLNFEDTKEAVKRLNVKKVTTIFEMLGYVFIVTKNNSDRNSISFFITNKKTMSHKEKSKYEKTLGTSFFNIDENSFESEKYSQRTKQILEDDSWLNDI